MPRAMLAVICALLAAAACGGTTGGDSGLQGPNVVRYPLEPHRFEGPTTTRVVHGTRNPDGSCTESGGATTRPGEHVQEIVVAYDPDTCRYEVVSGMPG